MKLDRENSKKNIIASDLKEIEAKLKKIKMSTGILGVTSIVLLFGTFNALTDLVYGAISSGDINVAQRIFDIVLFVFGVVASERLLVNIHNKQKQYDNLENQKNDLIEELEKIDALDGQVVELENIVNKPKTKGLVYFPKKNEEN